MLVTGCKIKYGYNKTKFVYNIHAPFFPYTVTTYAGMSLEEAKKEYRKKYNLKYKHIDWLLMEA